MRVITQLASWRKILNAGSEGIPLSRAQSRRRCVSGAGRNEIQLLLAWPRSC